MENNYKRNVMHMYVIKSYNADGRLVPSAYCLDKDVLDKELPLHHGFYGEKPKVEEIEVITSIEE